MWQSQKKPLLQADMRPHVRLPHPETGDLVRLLVFALLSDNKTA